MYPVTLATDSLTSGSLAGRTPGAAPEFGMLITGSNADADDKQLNDMLESFTRDHPNAVLHTRSERTDT